MGRLAHLQQTLPGALKQHGASHIVVDYSCPEDTGGWVERNCQQVKVVRVPGKAHFNVCAARNAGAAAADAPWLFFRDADIEVAPSFAAEVLPLLREGGHYLAVRRPIGPLAGALICSRSDWERLGGYDEVMQGWGYEDRDMYARLKASGSERRFFPTRLLQAIDHGDATRVANYEIKHREVSRLINHLYSLAKIELAAASGKEFGPQGRRRLYLEVRRAMPALLRGKGRKTVTIGATGGKGISFVFDPESRAIERASVPAA